MSSKRTKLKSKKRKSVSSNKKTTMKKGVWATVKEQLGETKVVRGSALEKLIQGNQDFHLLRPEEANDKIGLPPWLRVYWRKHHPEAVYSANDPTGGYPRVLKRLHGWMVRHQDQPLGSPDNPGGLRAAY
jgi:hypothetical protein